MITRLSNPFATLCGCSAHQTHGAELYEWSKKHNYVPLQTIEHAWAGMSGTLRFGGARGAFYVPRR